jgi:hypothetical protein
LNPTAGPGNQVPMKRKAKQSKNNLIRIIDILLAIAPIEITAGFDSIVA